MLEDPARGFLVDDRIVIKYTIELVVSQVRRPPLLACNHFVRHVLQSRYDGKKHRHHVHHRARCLAGAPHSVEVLALCETLRQSVGSTHRHQTVKH